MAMNYDLDNDPKKKTGEEENDYIEDYNTNENCDETAEW
jgi:hypothetical protein